MGGSAAWFFAWVAVFLAVGGSFFAGWAREDARGALISRYDEQVYVWSGDIADAYARKWRAMGETADGLPALTIQRTVSAAEINKTHPACKLLEKYNHLF